MRVATISAPCWQIYSTCLLISKKTGWEGDEKEPSAPARSLLSLSELLLEPPAFGAFSRQETKMPFSQTGELRSSPRSGTCLSSIGIFHLRLRSLLPELLQ